MKRIVAICGAVLAAVIIIGISVYSIQDIDRRNQKTREEEAAREFASAVAAQTTAGIDIWEIMKSTTTMPAETVPEGEIPPESGLIEGDTAETMPPELQEESPQPEVPQTDAAQTVTATVSTGMTVTIDQEGR